MVNSHQEKKKINSHHRPFSLETLSNVWIRPGSVEAPPIPHKTAPSSHLCSWAPYYNLGHNRAINVNRALSVSTRPRGNGLAPILILSTQSDRPDGHFKDGRRKFLFHPSDPGVIRSFYKSSARMTTFAQPVVRLFDQMSLKS